ncbi:MAG TPA: RDD family protein [Terriglobales bacterium]|nr:RDD family protein [Terriglobales bacterium]
MKPRFEPGSNRAETPLPPPILVDPEAYDASEQRFAASLEEKPQRPQFVVDEPVAAIPTSSEADSTAPRVTDADGSVQKTDLLQSSPYVQQSSTANNDSWRQELQAKISHYRARKRPRPPRYPSLQLKFESAQSPWSASAADIQPAISEPPDLKTPETQDFPSHQGLPSAESATYSPVSESEPKAITSKIPDFLPPVQDQLSVRDELADPVFDHPPILETPEVLPPPPALGGILIETVDEQVHEKRPGIDLPLQPASMSRRMLALAIDGLFVILAAMLFAYIFFRITSSLIELRHVVLASGAVIASFWIGYQYLLLVYTGTTPGLRFSRLRLSRFDGRPVPQRVRRWRVLASVLSGLSLGLGYAWCFFDEDRLCWHDRITHTYMAPVTSK